LTKVNHSQEDRGPWLGDCCDCDGVGDDTEDDDVDENGAIKLDGDDDPEEGGTMPFFMNER
jgi:hypothetical protein